MTFSSVIYFSLVSISTDMKYSIISAPIHRLLARLLNDICNLAGKNIKNRVVSIDRKCSLKMTFIRFIRRGRAYITLIFCSILEKRFIKEKKWKKYNDVKIRLPFKITCKLCREWGFIMFNTQTYCMIMRCNPLPIVTSGIFR